MDSQFKSVEEQQFLEAIALQLNLTGDTLATFLARFNRKNAGRENVTLVSFIAWNKEPEDASQKLQDELKKICQIFEDNGGPSNKPKRGRAAKGQSPWQQGYKWLWESRFPEWQRQNNQPLSLPGEICRKGEANIDALVQEVRSRLHDDIQRLHGTMPLWGVDRWVPLGELFVDVNILEKLSSSRMSELDDLWQDFSKNPSYRSLDRMGSGRERERVSGLEVVAKNTNLMVVGKPGSGKTTYLQRVVTECNAGKLQAHRIPVLIRLRDFVKKEPEVAYALKPYLEKCWQLSDAETLLKQGRVLVLLDGLDEVTGENGKKITKEIKKFAGDYPQVQVIVTCRTQSQESRFERFDYVEVADFDKGQVRSFSEHWFKTVMRDESAGLARAGKFLDQLFLESHKPIRDLAITPILLSLTCAVFHETGKFYSKRSMLYKKGLELLLERWDELRGIERDEIYRDLSAKRKRELLKYLAMKKFEQTQYVLFEQTEIEGYIAEFLEIGQRDSRAVLRAMEAQHGLLIERAQKVWSFSHLTFQEYLVACKIAESCNSDSASDATLQALASYIINNQWKEVILLTAEMLNNANALVLGMEVEVHKLIDEGQLAAWFNWANYSTTGSRGNFHPAIKRASAVCIACTLSPDSVHNMVLADCVSLIINLIDRLECSHILREILQKFQDLGGYRFRPKSQVLYTGQELSSTVHLAEIFSIIDFEFLATQLQELEFQMPKIDIVHGGNSYNVLRDFTDRVLQVWWEGLILQQEWDVIFRKEIGLMNYLKANEILVQCKETSVRVSPEIWDEIKDRMLLPIAEIEKRKREKTD